MKIKSDSQSTLGLFSLLVEVAPLMDMSTRSAFMFLGEPGFPDAKDFS